MANDDLQLVTRCPTISHDVQEGQPQAPPTLEADCNLAGRRLEIQAGEGLYSAGRAHALGNEAARLELQPCRLSLTVNAALVPANDGSPIHVGGACCGGSVDERRNVAVEHELQVA